MKKIAILASGAGTNAENIAQYFSQNDRIKVALIVSNNPKAGVLERAVRLGVPSEVVLKADWASGESVVALLRRYEIDFIVLAGFLCMVPDALLRAFPDRIVNIHPALLPKFGGKGMYGMRVHEAVVAAGVAESGITIHYINEHYDEGAIIFQTSCKLLPTDTAEDVATKVHTLEYTHYPRIIEQLLTQEA